MPAPMIAKRFAENPKSHEATVPLRAMVAMNRDRTPTDITGYHVKRCKPGVAYGAFKTPHGNTRGGALPMRATGGLTDYAHNRITGKDAQT